MLLVVVGLALYFSERRSTTAPMEDDSYRFLSVPCWFDAPWQETVRCGELHTPASTGKFILPVVIIGDNSSLTQSDPVFYLQGGPGSSAGLDTDGIRYWLNWRDSMALGRDLIVMDPRGVGRSRPSLSCKAYDEFSLSVLTRDTSVEGELAEGHEILQRCFLALNNNEAFFKPQYYGTYLHAQDVAALMRLLPYQQWNLLGVSYGTRVALEAANQSDNVRSLLLDSVYPVGRGGVQSFPAVMDQAFANFFTWCSTEVSCSPRTSTIEEVLKQVLIKLKKHPLIVTVPRRDGEVPVNLVVNDHRFISALFSSLYNKHQWPKIPKALAAALDGNSQGLLPLMEPFIHNALDDDFNGLVFMAVDCRDHTISTEEEYQLEVNKYPLWMDYTRDLWRYQACHFLRAPLESAELQKNLPQVPALILAGELDPITPLAWAQELHRQWPGSQFYSDPDTGHAVINSDECIYQSLRGFFDDPHKKVEFCAEKNDSKAP